MPDYRPHVRIISVAAFLAAFSGPVFAQADAGGITLTATAIDTLDDNRFFTRLGGTARADVTYEGLEAGRAYTLVAQLLNPATGERDGEPVPVTFTPDLASGTLSLELPVPQNRTPFNIDYVVALDLLDGERATADLVSAEPLARLEDTSDLSTALQVHAIQSISVTAVDAADGDHRMSGQGGVIRATVEHVNLVEGYHYTIWGQLLTPSGQSTGIFASVAEYVPTTKNSTLTLDFPVPEGRDGTSLVPSIGLYHQNRVAVHEDGSLTWLPEAKQPVTIGSDPNVIDPAKIVEIGIPFEDTTPPSQ
jgi:hypothetical protein